MDQPETTTSAAATKTANLDQSIEVLMTLRDALASANIQVQDVHGITVRNPFNETVVIATLLLPHSPEGSSRSA